MGAAGTIEVRRNGSGFVVEVLPPAPAYPVAHFDDLRTAWGHAGGIRIATGWRKVDLTGEGRRDG